MFYGYEQAYKSFKELEKAIETYIFYYNNKRTNVSKLNLKDLVLSHTELSPLIKTNCPTFRGLVIKILDFLFIWS